MSEANINILGVIVFGMIFLLFNYRTRKILRSSMKSIKSEKDVYFPPLPDEVVNLLSASKLCFLATVNDCEPHLSLMNFTYYRKDEVIIFCTRRDTKKFKQIQACKNVSILIHDFPHLINDSSNKCNQQWSITLNGIATCLDNDDFMSNMYR
jgi:hypothetical protein